MRMIPDSQIRLFDGELLRREAANRQYMLSLNQRNLMFNFNLEAGRDSTTSLEGMHGGWELPSCQLRGHFIGHWLSAAAMRYAATGDAEIKARADAIVDELDKCQQENGGEWVASIPEKYFDWIARGKSVWAPHYTVHKTFMGLIDMYRYAGNEQALRIAEKFADWFYRWSGKFTREQMDDILDYETGGMLEIWAELFGIARARGDDERTAMYGALMERYWRGRLFDRLLRGEDPLTNMHANTTIPEVLGCARAYELTGEQKYRDVVEAYWRCAVDERGQYATGGQTCGEIWTPKQELSARLGEKNQEHCTVYNMMRLADALLRWTGEARYADYIELNLFNGIFAQGYWQGNFTHGAHSDDPDTGLLTYFLPLQAGGRKGWATRTNDFFCCHGTLVQANASLTRYMAYDDDRSISLCQYFDADICAELAGKAVTLISRRDTLAGSVQSFSTNAARQALGAGNIAHLPGALVQRITLRLNEPAEFALRLRIPDWRAGDARLLLNDQPVEYSLEQGFARIARKWHAGDQITLIVPRGVRTVRLPDAPDMVAFCYGPVTLAGLCDEERALYTDDPAHPDSLLTPDNEREWGNWKTTFRTVGQARGLRFIPLMDVGYQPYTVYFPVARG